MPEESNKWKSKILSSGIPLEFEISKLLKQRGLKTENEYSYIRKLAVIG